MFRERSTKETVRVGERDSVEVYLDARAQVLRVAKEVRTIGLGVQADQLEEVAGVLVPPTFQGVLASLGDRQRGLSPKQGEFLVMWLNEVAEIVRDLRDDAEITGSHEAHRRAGEWLNRLGL